MVYRALGKSEFGHYRGCNLNEGAIKMSCRGNGDVNKTRKETKRQIVY